jgi:hypothetical protein
VDSLPFDLKTNLWEDDSEIAWQEGLFNPHGSMVSLHEWSDGLAAGRVYDVSIFTSFILAACKGRGVSTISSPPVNSYIDS